ncbi:hypothetical protein AF332_20515 [Sporosarcina globispora]|uniref:Uncharacterized protein n=1 Tax=Sporosarcina globispora TaxID=1459 RepID=A0A0M0GHH8_SPOGL|nr:hypothetical protein AF332_20515 [Sporosarcina globispora]
MGKDRNRVINVTLLAWVPSTGALTFFFEGGFTTARVLSTTTTRRAQLNRFLPGDPIFPLVTRWNALISSGRTTFGQTNTDNPNTFSGITNQLVSLNARMRIQLRSGILVALRPIP